MHLPAQKCKRKLKGAGDIVLPPAVGCWGLGTYISITTDLVIELLSAGLVAASARMNNYSLKECDLKKRAKL